jgi:hypothetical protein
VVTFENKIDRNSVCISSIVIAMLKILRKLWKPSVTISEELADARSACCTRSFTARKASEEIG